MIFLDCNTPVPSQLYPLALARLHHDKMRSMAETKEKPDAISRIRKLKEQIATIEEEAVNEALERAKKAVEELNELGRHYRLTDEPESISGRSGAKSRAPRKSAGSKATPGPSANYDETKHCPICNINSHDGRMHRSQGAKKKPFTQQELAEKGLLPPA